MEQMDFSIELSESEIEKFADYLYQKENAKATINKYMADIKKFLSFLADDKRKKKNYGIFRVTAKQPAFVAFLCVNVAEHVSGEDNADVLVCRGKVQEQSGTYGGCYHAGCILHEADEQGSDASQHAACRHGSTETHGADDEPDGIHHTCHTSCGNQFCQHVTVSLQTGTAIECHHYPFEHIPTFRYLIQLSRLEDEGEYPCQQSGEKECDDGRHSPGNQHSRNHGNSQ